MKYLKVFFIFCLINIFLINYSFCDDSIEEVSSSDINEIMASTDVTDEPKIYSRRAVVFERNSKTVIYDKNMNEKCAMASTTKIMTCILILENCNLSDTVTVSKKSAGTGGSRLGLKTGDKITVHDLLYGLMLCSGNDSAVALAEHLGGSVEGFANMMNEKANSLGLKSTHFVTPHGLDDPNHFTTAYELALLTDYALNNKDFRTIVGTHNYTVTINGYSKNLSNSNELLGNLNGVYGVKTGFTGNAGRCLVTATNRNTGLDIITIVLGADTKKIRTSDSAKLINYCLDNYTIADLNSKIQEKYSYFEKYIKPNISIYKAKNDNFEVYLEDFKYKFYALKKTDSKNITVTLDSISSLEAPVSKNYPIGKISVLVNNELLFSTDILVTENIERKDYLYYFKDFITNYRNILTNF